MIEELIVGMFFIILGIGCNTVVTEKETEKYRIKPLVIGISSIITGITIVYASGCIVVLLLLGGYFLFGIALFGTIGDRAENVWKLTEMGWKKSSILCIVVITAGWIMIVKETIKEKRKQ